MHADPAHPAPLFPQPEIPEPHPRIPPQGGIDAAETRGIAWPRPSRRLLQRRANHRGLVIARETVLLEELHSESAPLREALAKLERACAIEILSPVPFLVLKISRSWSGEASDVAEKAPTIGGREPRRYSSYSSNLLSGGPIPGRVSLGVCSSTRTITMPMATTGFRTEAPGRSVPSTIRSVGTTRISCSRRCTAMTSRRRPCPRHGAS
jgi:hypothetical protein